MKKFKIIVTKEFEVKADNVGEAIEFFAIPNYATKIKEALLIEEPQKNDKT